MEGSESFCCADLYRSDAVRMLLGDTWHPGGLELTGRLGSGTRLSASDLVVDVACGVGASSLFLSQRFGCSVVGLDVNPANMRQASKRTGPREDVRFIAGDSGRTPFADHSFDAAVLECVLSTFGDKRGAICEVARVLKPGGRVGISDVIVEGELPPELDSPILQGFCVSGARSTGGYVKLLQEAGFEVLLRENRKSEAIQFVEEIRRKLFVAQLLVGLGKLNIEKEDLDMARDVISVASKEIQQDRLGYALLVARRGQ
jgi:arsenite methyltransferase